MSARSNSLNASKDNCRRLIRTESPAHVSTRLVTNDEQSRAQSKVLIQRQYGSGRVDWFETADEPNSLDLIEPHACLAFERGLLLRLILRTFEDDPAASLPAATRPESYSWRPNLSRLSWPVHADCHLGKERRTLKQRFDQLTSLPVGVSVSAADDFKSFPEFLAYAAEIRTVRLRDDATRRTTMALFQIAQKRLHQHRHSKSALIEEGNIKSAPLTRIVELCGASFDRNNRGRMRLRAAILKSLGSVVTSGYAAAFKIGEQIAAAVWNDVNLVRLLRADANSYLECAARVAANIDVPSGLRRQLQHGLHFLRTLDPESFMSFEEELWPTTVEPSKHRAFLGALVQGESPTKRTKWTRLQLEFVREYVRRKSESIFQSELLAGRKKKETPEDRHRRRVKLAIEALKVEFPQFGQLTENQQKRGLWGKKLPSSAAARDEQILTEDAFSPQQKFKAALMAIRARSSRKVAKKLRVDTSLIMKWVRQLKQHGPKVFDSAPAAEPLPKPNSR